MDSTRAQFPKPSRLPVLPAFLLVLALAVLLAAGCSKKKTSSTKKSRTSVSANAPTSATLSTVSTAASTASAQKEKTPPEDSRDKAAAKEATAKDKKKDSEADIPVAGPGEWLSIEGIQAFNYNARELESIVLATTGTVNFQTRIMALGNVRSRFFQNSKMTGKLFGDTGEIFMNDIPPRGMKKNDLLLTGNVRLERVDGSTLVCPALHYVDSDAKFYSVGAPVKKTIIMQGSTLYSTSDRFIANKEMTHFEDERVKEVINVPNKTTDASSTQTASTSATLASTPSPGEKPAPGKKANSKPGAEPARKTSSADSSPKSKAQTGKPPAESGKKNETPAATKSTGAKPASDSAKVPADRDKKTGGGTTKPISGGGKKIDSGNGAKQTTAPGGKAREEESVKPAGAEPSVKKDASEPPTPKPTPGTPPGRKPLRKIIPSPEADSTDNGSDSTQ